MFQTAGQPGRALEAYQVAMQAFPHDAALYVAAADAAFTLGRPALADSLLERANRICFRCSGALRVQARSARGRGDGPTADSLEGRAIRWDRP
jgi:hypothetical protein